MLLVVDSPQSEKFTHTVVRYWNKLRKGKRPRTFPRQQEEKKNRTGVDNTSRILLTKNPHVTEKLCTLEITPKAATATAVQNGSDQKVSSRKSDVRPRCNRRSAPSGLRVRTGRTLLGIFVVDGRSGRPRRHSFVDLIEIFRLGKSADFVRWCVCT